MSETLYLMYYVNISLNKKFLCPPLTIEYVMWLLNTIWLRHAFTHSDMLNWTIVCESFPFDSSFLYYIASKTIPSEGGAQQNTGTWLTSYTDHGSPGRRLLQSSAARPVQHRWSCVFLHMTMHISVNDKTIFAIKGKVNSFNSLFDLKLVSSSVQ